MTYTLAVGYLIYYKPPVEINKQEEKELLFRTDSGVNLTCNPIPLKLQGENTLLHSNLCILSLQSLMKKALWAMVRKATHKNKITGYLIKTVCPSRGKAVSCGMGCLVLSD